MRIVLFFIVIGLTFTSCQKDKLVGQWTGKAEYTSNLTETDQCSTFDFEIFKTESNAYYGTGTLKYLDCNSGQIDSSSDFRITSVVIDNPMIYFELRLDESPDNVRFKFQGTIENKSINGKFYTWTSSSSSFDQSFKIKLLKLE